MNKYIYIILSIFGFSQVQAQTIEILPIKAKNGFRGLSVVDDRTIWVSGTRGSFGRSTNAGKTWYFDSLPKYSPIDFRDIEGFDSMNAIILAASTPAYILVTHDGGQTWQETYKNDDKRIFFDGMDFWDDKNGIAWSDPIDGRMYIIITHNGGQTWQPLPDLSLPIMAEGEAGFAASGTTIRCIQNNHIFIATGGTKSRLLHSADRGKTWSVGNIPIIQGAASQGTFSIAFPNINKGVAVGGDYLKDSSNINNCYYTKDGGRTWTKADVSPGGYRSCVEYLAPQKMYITTGNNGTDISKDMGKTWQSISKDGFFTVRQAKKGKLVVLSGAKGKIAILK